MRKLLGVAVFVIGFSNITVVAGGAPGTASDWPQWRGPEGTGVGQAENIPNEWSSTKNVKWKKRIPGLGHATPIILGDRIFIATAVEVDKSGKEVPRAAVTQPDRRRPGRDGVRERGPDRRRPEGRGRGEGRGRRGGRGRGGFGGRTPTNDHRFMLMCLDRTTGNTVWEKAMNKVLPHEGVHPRYGSYASGSPITDGENVYISFGSFGVYCCDLDGNVKWDRQLGKMQVRAQFGEGSSPALYGDTLVVQFDHEGDSFIAALNKHTGKTIWKKNRSDRSSWSTPAVINVNGSPQVVALGSPEVRGYDLASGRELWHCGEMTLNAIPSITVGHGLIYAMSGFRGAALRAIRIGSTGDLNQKPRAVAWSLDRGTPYVPSPLLYGDEIYLLQDRGLLSCHDAKTGQAHYKQERLPGVQGGRFHASPVGAGNKIYLAHESGMCLVLERGTKLNVLATNQMDEQINGSPAIAGGELFIRGDKHLYCIGRTN